MQAHFLVHRWHLSTCPLMAEGDRDLSWVFSIRALTRSLASCVCGVVAETRQIHRTTESCGGKGMARPLSQGERERPDPCLDRLSWLNLHRNTGCIWKAHPSLPGSNNQIDDIQRTLRAYSESGSNS